MQRQRPSLAARRFYRAFYQWNVLTSHAERQWLPPTSSCAPAFHSSGLQNDEADGVPTDEAPLFRRHVTSVGKVAFNRREGGFESQTIKEPRTKAIPKAMLESEAVSTTKKPFRAMDAGQYVVRFRSDAGLMLEYAIAGDKLQEMRQKFGAKLKELGTRTGARIEVQELFKKREETGDLSPQNMVHSVLISGTFREVVDVFYILDKRERRTPDVNDGRSVLTLTRRQRQRQQWRKQQPSNLKNYPKSWREDPIRSASELPSSDLPRGSGTPVVRARTKDQLALEQPFPSPRIAEWQARYGEQLEFLKWRSGCDIVVKELTEPEAAREERTEGQHVSTEAPQTSWHAIYVSGPWKGVQQTWDELEKAIRPFSEIAAHFNDHSQEPLGISNLAFRQLPDQSWALDIALLPKHCQQLLEDREFRQLVQALKTSFTTKSMVSSRGPNGDTVDSRLITVTGPGEALLTIRRAFRLMKYDLGKSKSMRNARGTPNQDQKPEGQSNVTHPEQEDNSPAIHYVTSDTAEKQAPPSASGKGKGKDKDKIFTSLVEICPEDARHERICSHVLVRLDTIRTLTLTTIKNWRTREHLQLITGSDENVARAKDAITKLVAEAYRKFEMRSRCIRTVHERYDWTPSWREVDELVAQLDRGPSQGSSNANSSLGQSASKAANQSAGNGNDASIRNANVEPSLYRVVIQAGGRGAGKEIVMQKIRDRLPKLPSPVDKLKDSTGCQDVVFLKDRIIAHGTLESVVKFRDRVENLLNREQRQLSSQDRSLLKISSRVHASLSSAWARLPEIHQAPGVDEEKASRLAEDVRIALRPLSHPVALITSRAPRVDVDDVNGENDEFASQTGLEASVDSNVRRSRGITVSSFNTVALRPQPLVSFNISIPSRSWDAISSSADLRVHLLTATPIGAAMADCFTKGLKQPYSGFLQLKQLGVEVKFNGEDAPPILFHREGVLAELRAKLLPERCMSVGDHIIVVARVTSCFIPGAAEEGLKPAEVDRTFWDSIGGLAYAKQSYRNVGAQINKPDTMLLPEDLPDPLSLAEDAGQQEASRSRLNLQPEKHERIDSASTAVEDQEAVALEDELEFDDDLSPAAREEEDDYDFGFETPNYGVKRDHRSSSSTRDSRVSSQASASNLWGPEDVVHEDSIRLGGSARPKEEEESKSEATSDHNTYRPMFPNSNAPGSRGFSTLARPMKISARQFSTTARVAKDPVHDNTDMDHLVEPSARNMNVADYLGVPENGRLHSHRVRSLFRMNKDARRAEKRLLERNTELTEEDKSQLRHQITTNDRIIAKKLAWNAAYHLRIMLDKGRVDFKRAQFLESAIEKGQSVLLEEASSATSMCDQGRINFEQLQRVKKNLAREADVYQTELTRLGQIVDEEGDGGGVFPGVEGSDEGFDGFRGNR